MYIRFPFHVKTLKKTKLLIAILKQIYKIELIE